MTDETWTQPGRKPTTTIREIELTPVPGFLMLAIGLGGLLFSALLFIGGAAAGSGPAALLGVVVFVVSVFILAGLIVVNPNEAKVLQLFGDYCGTVRVAGLRWANPFYSKRTVSQRVRNFESEHLKVNDHSGNPIEIAAIVVWKVVDTAEAIFHVENYDNFVRVQSESALRNLAMSYPYDCRTATARSRCGAIPPRPPSTSRSRSRSGWRRPAWRCSMPASATWPMRPRSPTPCFSASRPAP